MLEIRICPMCRQAVDIDESLLEGEFICSQCGTQVVYKKEQRGLTMKLHAPQDVDDMQRRYSV